MPERLFLSVVYSEDPGVAKALLNAVGIDHGSVRHTDSC